jgi:microcystin-dependent protein
MGADSPFLGEIHMFAGNFPPVGWAFCDGQLLPISQNTALFSLLGTTYGGNGISTFALPDLRGRVPLHRGQGPGLSPYSEGQSGGQETVALLASQMPSHTHLLNVSGAPGTTANPQNAAWAASSTGAKQYSTTGNAGTTAVMAPGMLAPNGSGLPHNNMQPSLVLSYIIALQGVFPSRP